MFAQKPILTKLILALVLIFLSVGVMQRIRPPAPIPNQLTPSPSPSPSPAHAPEITAIKATSTFSEQTTLYIQLMKRVGPEKAQEELLASGLPFDGQTHLLNHSAGDWLYEQFGSAGLAYCKDYFLSSCYHGFVIRAVADGGFERLGEVMRLCRQKGGEPVAAQCSHAIGHGFLAWVGYKNLPQALAHCDSLANKVSHFPFYNCHDGVFMENIWAVHETGKPSAERWLKDDDPVYPCNDPRIESRYIQACWSNQPMRMYQMFHEDLARVAKECVRLTNTVYQKTCFDSLARQIHPLTHGGVEKTFLLCSTMPKPWDNACVISIAKASFGVGDRTIPFELCERIENDVKTQCFQELSDIITSYTMNDLKQKDILCNKLPTSPLQQRCKDQKG